MTTEPPPSIPPWFVTLRFVSVLVLVHALAWVPLLLFMLQMVPRYKLIFADFGMKLPELTMEVVDWSDFIVNHPIRVGAALAVFLVLDGAILFLLRRYSSTPLLSWLWFILVALLPLSAWICAWLSMWLPLEELMEDLAK